MVRFDARMATVALLALLVACGSGSHQPEPPAAVPSSEVQPQVIPSAPVAPDSKTTPKKAPRDSAGTGSYPWQSAPIASL